MRVLNYPFSLSTHLQPKPFDLVKKIPKENKSVYKEQNKDLSRSRQTFLEKGAYKKYVQHSLLWLEASTFHKLYMPQIVLTLHTHQFSSWDACVNTFSQERKILRDFLRGEGRACRWNRGDRGTGGSLNSSCFNKEDFLTAPSFPSCWLRRMEVKAQKHVFFYLFFLFGWPTCKRSCSLRLI